MPDSFNDWYIQETGKNTVGEDVLRHVRRELFQAQWAALLDEEFLHAYEHGLVIDCPDKVRRRFYPRIMTYSADYPERWILLPFLAAFHTNCPTLGSRWWG